MSRRPCTAEHPGTESKSLREKDVKFDPKLADQSELPRKTKKAAAMHLGANISTRVTKSSFLYRTSVLAQLPDDKRV